MPAPRPARGRKSPSIQAFRSRAARRGRPAGDKACAAPPGTARAGGHSRAGASAAVVGGAWLVLKSTIRTSSGVTTSRSIWPETSAGGWPGRSSRPTIDTSARLPGANTGANRAIRDQRQHAFRQRLALVLGPVRRHCGRDSASAASRRRSVAISGSDCSSRCTSVPRCSARARNAIDSPVRTRWPSSSAGIGRAQQAVGGRFRWRRRPQP